MLWVAPDLVQSHQKKMMKRQYRLHQHWYPMDRSPWADIAVEFQNVTENAPLLLQIELMLPLKDWKRTSLPSAAPYHDTHGAPS
jgi:hypothetical protein